MAKEQSAPTMQYTGNTLEEQFQSARMFQIGLGVLQRFGQQMTDDERYVISIGLQVFARQPIGEEGARPLQTQPATHQPPTQSLQNAPQPTAPAQQPVPPRRK